MTTVTVVIGGVILIVHIGLESVFRFIVVYMNRVAHLRVWGRCGHEEATAKLVRAMGTISSID